MKRSFKVVLCFLLLSFSQVATGSKDVFDVAMGSKTKHWAYIQTQVDKDSLETFRELFHRNSPLVKSAAGAVQIPKVVHFIWLGPRSFPPGSVSNVRSWMAQNPDWKFIFWTDRPREAPCQGMETIVLKEYPFPYLGRCYAASENWGEKSDVLRFEILYSQGGVYVDHDASCLTPFEPYHQAYKFYAGLETPHPPVVGRSITAGNGVIGSCPGHPIVKKVIELIDQRWDSLKEKYPGSDGFSRTQIVMERTYIALTDALDAVLDKTSTNDIVFPATYFFPKKGLKPVLSEHFFANSWASSSDGKEFEKKVRQDINRVEKKFNRLNMFLFSVMGINLLVLMGYVFINKKRVI
jgi:mannosyltransferase OCH1-like enzyme